jgi:two-component system OmpR family sensor kinase
MVQPPDAQWLAADHRVLRMLQRLLAIQEVALRPVLSQASTIIAETFKADKVDVFVYEETSDSLVALGTSNTLLGQQQRTLGLDRLSLSGGGRAAWVFRTGDIHTSGHADTDHEELRGIVDPLGVRSVIDIPILVAGARRGVLQVDSVTPSFFTDHDISALTAVAGWVGLIMHRAELAEQMAAEAARHARVEVGNEVARITRRQREVASLIAEGLSNAEIAQRLVLSEGTVANHTEAILRRLGLKSRTQVAVWAVERGLYRSDMNGAD